MKIDENSTRQQSLAAYGQWKHQWREHATYVSKFAPLKSFSDFESIGLGKSVLCVANGYSFEKNIETIKKYQSSVDIMACDKTLGHLIDNGIKPKYCLLCDANVSYSKYLEPYKDKLNETILFSNVCANTRWMDENWKDRYFFVNEDVIKSEKEFMALSGCKNKIPAATNVSNAMVVLLTQSDNNGRRNFFCYDKISLIGFDYCWNPLQKYYSFNKDGNGKSNYMRHICALDNEGKLVYTSTNLLFSMEWLKKYITVFKLPVVQCSYDSILGLKHHETLESQLTYAYKQEDVGIVQKLLKERRKLLKECTKIESRLKEIGEDHYYSFLATA